MRTIQRKDLGGRMNQIARTIGALVLTPAFLLVGMAAAQVTLSGTVENWEGGEARVVAEVRDELGVPSGVLAEGPLDEDGSFTLELPAEVPDELLGTIDAGYICDSGGLALEPESFRGTIVFGLNVYRDDAVIGFVAPASSEAAIRYVGAVEGDHASFLVHADRAVTVRGTCVKEDEGVESNDLDLQPGWNVVTSTAVGVTDEGVPSELENLVVSDLPETVRWFFIRMGAE